MEAWPTSALPKPTTALQVRRDPAVLRTGMDDGHVRQRQRFTITRDTFRTTWHLTDSQLEFFRAWLEHKVSNGNDWFTMDLPYGGGYINQTTRIVDGRLNTRHVTNGVFDWIVTATVEVEDIDNLIEDTVDGLIYAGIDSLHAMEQLYSTLHVSPFTGDFHVNLG